MLGDEMSAVQNIAVPPHNIEAEKSVLGAVLLDERHLHSLLIEEHLRPEHFYREQHGAVFAAMLALYESDRKIDHLTVAETLRQHGKLEEVGGAQAIDELAGWVPAAGHAREYGRIVRDNAQMRALLTASYEIQASVLSREAPARELVEQAERSMLEVAHDDRQKKVRTIADILHEETDKLHRLSVLKTPLTGTPSGFKDLDEKTGGFQGGNLVIVAARPSMGKSALVANVAENAVLAGHAVALFSLEMSESELAQRFVASQARIKGEDLRRGRVAEHRWPKILEACQRLSDAPLFVDDSSDTGVLEVRAKARRLHHQVEGGLGLIIIDYLQLMRHEGRVESRVEQVSQISRGLKGLARELNVPVIALSQLSRAVEQRGGDKKPVLSDLRESGAIEQDADLVMFIYREEYYDRESERPGEADIIIAKHRNGPVGEVVLTFQKEYPKFMNYAGERFARVSYAQRDPDERAAPAGRRMRLRPVRRLRLPVRPGDEHRLRLPVPRPAGRPGEGSEPLGGHPAALPGRVVRPAAGDRHRPAGRGRDAPVRGSDQREARRRARALVHGTRWHRQDNARDARRQAALKAGRSVAIYSLPRLLNEIRETHRADRSHVDLLDRLTAVDLLHVDDVGAERTTDWVLEELYSIVNARYEDERSMVITTNILDREALCEQITERTVSRLTEMCDELPLIGADRRMGFST